MEKLAWDPEFYDYVRDAFAPVGVMIDAWAERYASGAGRNFSVMVVNDLYESWQGTIRFRLLGDSKTFAEQTQSVEISALGSGKFVFAIDIPHRPGHYQARSGAVESRRHGRAKPARVPGDAIILHKPNE